MEDQEKYLFCLRYTIEDHHYTYFEYFKNQKEAEEYFKVYSAPHIHIDELQECKNGANWLSQFFHHKQSDWHSAHPEIWEW